MLDEKKQKDIRANAMEYFNKAGIALSEEEIINELKIFDYESVDFYTMGIVIVTFINTERYCGRFILFFPDNVLENTGILM